MMGVDHRRRISTGRLSSILCLLIVALPGGSGFSGTAAPQDPKRAAVVQFWQSFNEATALRMKKNFAAASQSYEQALAINPGHEDSLYYLGQCRQELHDYGAAREAFTRLIAIDASSSRGHIALGALFAIPDDDSAPLDLQAAEQHLRAAHAINGEETGPVVRLGEVLIARGDRKQAAFWLDGAVRQNPKSVEAAFLAGYLRWEAGDLAGARTYYQKAVKAAKTDAPVKGVLSEGDRKSVPVATSTPAQTPAAGAVASSVTHVAAPPLTAPMGKTLFGAFSAPLRGPSAPAADALITDAMLAGAFVPVRAFRSHLEARAAGQLPAGAETSNREATRSNR